MTPRLRDKARDMSGDLAMLKAPLWARVAAVNIAQTTPGPTAFDTVRAIGRLLVIAAFGALCLFGIPTLLAFAGVAFGVRW